MTLRATPGLPTFRSDALFEPLRRALLAASGASFRVIEFSVQSDHLHLVIEADHPGALSRGIHGLAIRAAKAVNRALHRRGRVWGDRFHARALATPREVRIALVYVLNNARKHIPTARGFDPRSSALWFTGWQQDTRSRPEPSPLMQARTWLARIGWRRHGLIRIDETPARR